MNKLHKIIFFIFIFFIIFFNSNTIESFSSNSNDLDNNKYYKNNLFSIIFLEIDSDKNNKIGLIEFLLHYNYIYNKANIDNDNYLSQEEYIEYFYKKFLKITKSANYTPINFKAVLTKENFYYDFLNISKNNYIKKFTFLVYSLKLYNKINQNKLFKIQKIEFVNYFIKYYRDLSNKIKLTKYFKANDSDHDNYLTNIEIRSLAKFLMYIRDLNKDKYLDQEEFLSKDAILKYRQYEKQNIENIKKNSGNAILFFPNKQITDIWVSKFQAHKNLFLYIDKNNNNKISTNEFIDYCSNKINKLDLDKDNRIFLQEFINNSFSCFN